MNLKKRTKALIVGLLTAGCPVWFALPAQAETVASVPGVHAVQPLEDTLKVKVSVIDNRIIVTDAPAKSRLEIYNIVGIRVKEIEIKHPSEEYVVSLPKGYYIVRIEETVRKIVIR
ncbi:MAG: T9SS type A sorting domain-containing protein [Tannerella sp.]|nr:T9SS type A sorting domain-containing protein [Tannerella sp.]